MRPTTKEGRRKKHLLNTKIVDSNKHITYQWSDEGSGHYTQKEDMYMSFFKKMLPEFNGGVVLEVGPGTGKFANQLFYTYDISDYIILDLEDNINDSRNFLDSKGYNVQYVCSQDYETLFDNIITLFVSNVCLPEVPEYYCKNLVDHMFPNSDYAFVIGGNEFSYYNDWIKEVFNKYFTTVDIQETGYGKTFAISGKDKK